MIKKHLDYEKKSFDLENVYSAFKKISDNINYISVGKELGKNETEDIKLNHIEDLLKLKAASKDIKKIIIMTSDKTIVFLSNTFSKILSVSITAKRKEIITQIKGILEEELDLKEITD